MILLDTGKLSTSDHEERPVAENPGTLLLIRLKENNALFLVTQGSHRLEKYLNSEAVILLPVHPASFAHKFLFQRVPASPRMQ